MNGDPFLVGLDSAFPNQNSSTAPTVWEEDTFQAAQQGIPCATGPMLRLRKRSNNQPFLPGGAVNPCAESAPFCLWVDNLRDTPAGSQRLSASLIGAGLVGGQFVGGMPGAAGLGVVGVGAPGDGVRGIAGGAAPSGHGVAGFTASANHAGALGETSAGGVGVQGRSSNQAVRGDGGRFGVVGRGTATGVDGTGAGESGFGVVGRGTATGVHGTGASAGGFGVVGTGTARGVDGTGTRGGRPRRRRPTNRERRLRRDRHRRTGRCPGRRPWCHERDRRRRHPWAPERRLLPVGGCLSRERPRRPKPLRQRQPVRNGRCTPWRHRRAGWRTSAAHICARASPAWRSIPTSRRSPVWATTTTSSSPPKARPAGSTSPTAPRPGSRSGSKGTAPVTSASASGS
jgi:hypothetical protein